MPTSTSPRASAKLVPVTDTPHDAHFGWQVAVSGDLAVAGAWPENNFAGATYVMSMSNWTQLARLVPPGEPVPGGTFGTGVSVYNDIIVVGSVEAYFLQDPGPGSAYVYVRQGDEFIQTARLVASDAQPGALFGSDVALYEDCAVIGAAYDSNDGGIRAGAAYVFQTTDGGYTWSEVTKIESTEPSTDRHFGFPVDISAAYVAIGANDFDILSRGFNAVGQGAVFVFTHVGDHQATLTASDGQIGDEFGTGLTIQDDLIVVGAPRHGVGGAVYVYDTTSWNEVAQLESNLKGDYFGRSVHVRDGVMLVGSNVFGLPDGDPGYAEVFVASNASTWRSFARIDTQNYTDFGAYVAIAEDGVLLVSAFQDFDGYGEPSGAVYAYNMPGSFAVHEDPVSSSSKKSNESDLPAEAIIVLVVVGFFALLAVLLNRRRLRHKSHPTIKVDGPVEAPTHYKEDEDDVDSPW